MSGCDRKTCRPASFRRSNHFYSDCFTFPCVFFSCEMCSERSHLSQLLQWKNSPLICRVRGGSYIYTDFMFCIVIWSPFGVYELQLKQFYLFMSYQNIIINLGVLKNDLLYSPCYQEKNVNCEENAKITTTKKTCSTHKMNTVWQYTTSLTSWGKQWAPWRAGRMQQKERTQTGSQLRLNNADENKWE